MQLKHELYEYCDNIEKEDIIKISFLLIKKQLLLYENCFEIQF